MRNAKQDVERLLEQLPDDSTYEDIQYHLYVLEKIRQAEHRAQTESTLSQQQAEARLAKWLTE